MWVGFFKILGGSILTIALIWAMVLGWWQTNDFQPTTVDLLLYLGAIPLALIGGFWLLRGFIDHLKAPPVPEKPAAAPLADDDPLSSPAAKTSAAERGFSLCLINAAIQTRVGSSAAEIFAAIDAGDRPGPSKKMQDDDGFPVFLADIEDLDAEELIEQIGSDFPALNAFAQEPRFGRSLTLLEDSLPPLVSQAEDLLERSKPSSKLLVRWLLPADWEASHLSALRTWLYEHHLSAIDKTRVEITLSPATNEVDALRQLDDAVLALNRETQNNDLFLVIAAASYVDENCIQAWAASKRLFGAKDQDGQIPGESAACLLLATRATAELLALSDLVEVSRLSHAKRDKGVDAGGRISSKLIEQLGTGILGVRAIEASSVVAAIYDADHRANHVSEMLGGLGNIFEHLDPMKDCLPIATVTGTVSPVGGLLALACAREKVLETNAPVLCASNQHNTERGILAVTPFVSESTAIDL